MFLFKYLFTPLFKFHNGAEANKVSLVSALPGNPLLFLYWSKSLRCSKYLSFRRCVFCLTWYRSHKSFAHYTTLCLIFNNSGRCRVTDPICEALGTVVSTGIFHLMAQQFSHFLFSNLHAVAWKPLGFSELICWSLHEMLEKVGVPYKNKSLGKLFLSIGDVTQMAGKLLLRTEAVLNRVGLKILFIFFLFHLKVVLYFTFSFREIHSCPTCAAMILSA